MATTTYDRFRYPTKPLADSFPTLMAAAAHLRGRDFVPFNESRVLEIGCGEGGNLMSLAAIAPGAECIGFDLAEKPIADGRTLAAAAGLDNLRLFAGDILDPDVAEGTFDYVIAHGVYAWVPPPVRDAFMALVGRVLSPRGIAFISYNVLPGAYIRHVTRTIMQDAIGQTDEPEAWSRAVRDRLALFAGAWGAEEGPFAAALAPEIERLVQQEIGYTFHDELEDAYAPQLFSNTVAHARRHGLDYLCEAEAVANLHAFVPEQRNEAMWAAAGGDRMRMEQLEDFRLLRQFRQSLFVRGEAQAAETLDLERLKPLFLRTRFRSAEEPRTDGKVAFDTKGGGRFVTDDQQIAAFLRHLSASTPATVPVRSLPVDRVGPVLLRMQNDGLVEFLTEPECFTLVPGARPTASGLARAQVAAGMRELASLQHALVTVDEDGAALLSLLDGSNDRSAIGAAMAGRAADQIDVDQELLRLARLGLIAG